MPFNGSGTFQRVMNWVNDATAGIKIRADRHDQEDDNLAQGLSNCMTRDGQSPPTADIPMGAKKIINLADPVNAQDAVTKAFLSTIVGGAYISDTIPAAAGVGNLWWESDSGNLFVKYDDGDTTQWVQVNVGPPQDKISSVGVDMWAGFKTTGKFVVNDKVDGTGTDVLTMLDTGAMTVTGDINGGQSGLFASNVRSGPVTGARSLLTPGGLQVYNDTTYPVLIGNAAGSAYMTLGSSGVFNIVGGTFVFQGAGTNRMTINQTGYVNIPAPSAVSYGLDVRARTDYSAIIGFLGNTSFYGIVGYSLSPGYSFYGNVGAFLASGTWGTSDGQFKAVSGTVDGNDAIAQVMAIPVVAYTPASPAARVALGLHEDAPEEHFGFLAQDVEAVIPIAVRDVIPPDHDLVVRALIKGVKAPEEGSPEAQALGEEDITFKAMNDHYLLATLWAAVQALNARVEQLEAARAV